MIVAVKTMKLGDCDAPIEPPSRHAEGWHNRKENHRIFLTWMPSFLCCRVQSRAWRFPPRALSFNLSIL